MIKIRHATDQRATRTDNNSAMFYTSTQGSELVRVWFKSDISTAKKTVCKELGQNLVS